MISRDSDSGSQGGTPGDHDALAVVYSDPIAVAGAKKVVAEAVATNGGTLSAAVWQFTAVPDADLLAADAGWETPAAAGYAVEGALTTRDLSAAAYRMAATSANGFYHDWARLKLTVGAAAVTALAVTLQVLD